MISYMKKALLVFSTALLFSMPQLAAAADEATVVEKPSALAMTGDILIARPLLFVTTILGTVVYVASLPFSLAGGNAGEAGMVLVVKPAESTFIRCLGCKNPGYRKNIKSEEE